MMNYIWAIIFLASFGYACISGNLTAFGSALMESSQGAVSFILSLAGIMAMWSGLMKIAEETGLINKLSRLLLPFTTMLFPRQKDAETLSYIIMSFRTMEKLDAQNGHRESASNDMCTFAVVNMAFAPLIPVVTIQMREELGSSDPYSIVLPSLITAVVTIIVSVIVCKILERKDF